jgi:hypothetical protein
MSWHEARRKADIDDGTARSGLFTKLHLFVVAATEVSALKSDASEIAESPISIATIAKTKQAHLHITS